MNGVPIATEKKQTNLAPGASFTMCSFSKPISRSLIREDAFENGYRESRTREIAWVLHKSLRLPNNGRL